MLHKNPVLIILLLLFMHSNYAQTMDSLLLKSYDVLSDNVYKADSLTAFLSAKAYLIKARIEKDSLHMAYGFYYALVSNQKATGKINDSLTLKFSDSTISYSENLIKHKYFPSISYSLKGGAYYSKYNFKKALHYYLLALETNNFNIEYTYSLYYSIGVIKVHFGNYKEALSLLKKVYNYNNSTKRKVLFDKESDLLTVFIMSHAYLKNKQLDSAAYYYDQGYKESLNLKDKNFKMFFVLGKGVWQYYNENYQAVLDSLPKTQQYLIEKDQIANLAFSHCFLGKAHAKLGNKDKALLHFKKVDSLFIDEGDLHPDLRDTYPYLINHYKEKKDYKNQLKYTNNLLKLDSIYLENYTVIQNDLNKGFDQVNLRKEKESLEKKLGKEKEKGFWLYGFLVLILLIVGVFVVFIWRDKKLFKKGNLIANDNSQKTKQSSELSEAIKVALLQKLAIFEKNEGYLDPKIKISTLAKQLKTNTRYLSVVINSCKKQNFSQYINDLRIDYIITQLNEGTVYKKYSIEGIAKEIGFKNTESFSKAFLKKTGAYPSEYLKDMMQLN